MDVMDTDPQTPSTDVDQLNNSLPQQQQQPVKTQHNIAEIHRDMLALIPIPQAWSHIRHQSGLFSYPDLPHFNVIRQATFREGRFVCPFCTVDFASKEGIRYHLYNSCTKSPYPKAFFRCLMCGSELADRSSLRTHLARHVSEFDVFILEKKSFFLFFRVLKMVVLYLADKIDVSRKPAGSTILVEHQIRKNLKRKRKIQMI